MNQSRAWQLAAPSVVSLFTATLATGLFLLLVGGAFAWKGRPVGLLARKSLRSFSVTVILMGLGSAWFLYHVANLGEADFGNYKEVLFVSFFAVALLSFFFVRDLLAVRGGAILTLLTAKALLDAAYMQEPVNRLFLVTFVYLCIFLALYLGAVPFKLRDFLDWLLAGSRRIRLFGGVLTLYGLLLCGVAFGY